MGFTTITRGCFFCFVFGVWLSSLQVWEQRPCRIQRRRFVSGCKRDGVSAGGAGGCQVQPQTEPAVLPAKVTLKENRAATGSPLRFPRCPGIGSSPFFVWGLEVRVRRRRRKLGVWVLRHHFQLGLDGFDFCADATEETVEAWSS